MYVVAAGDDVELRHQVAISWLPLAASAVLLIIGAIVGGAAQTVLFAVALVGEWLSIYLTSRHGAWRIHSVSHWTERYGLFVIIAIGESIVAIGTGASDSALTYRSAGRVPARRHRGDLPLVAVLRCGGDRGRGGDVSR